MCAHDERKIQKIAKNNAINIIDTLGARIFAFFNILYSLSATY